MKENTKEVTEALLSAYREIKRNYLASPRALGGLLMSLGNAHERAGSLSGRQLKKVLEAARSRLAEYDYSPEQSSNRAEAIEKIDLALGKIRETEERRER